MPLWEIFRTPGRTCSCSEIWIETSTQVMFTQTWSAAVCQTGREQEVSLKSLTVLIWCQCKRQNSHQLWNDSLLRGNWCSMGGKQSVFSISGGCRSYRCREFEAWCGATAASCRQKKRQEHFPAAVEESLFLVLCVFSGTRFLASDQCKYWKLLAPKSQTLSWQK